MSTTSSTSSSTSTSGISFSGLASGIDTDSIITKLMSIKNEEVTNLQSQQTTLQNKQTAIGQITALVTALKSAAANLDSSSTFGAVTATSSNTSAVSVSASNGAAAGVHTIKISTLAQKQQIAGATFSSNSDPLGLTDGQIEINGHTVNIASTDTLQMIAANINSANAGVNATILSPSSGQYELVLSSSNSGTSNTMSISDVGSGTLASTSLGLISGSSNSETSFAFTDSATSIGTLLGQSSPSSGTVTINGQSVAIDFNTDTLSTIADRINATSGVGVTASVVAVTDSSTGTTKQQLKLSGASSATIVDSNNILANLGIVRNTAANQLTAATDASFTLDGVAMTRSSNHVTDALSNVTIDLLQDTNTPTANLTVASDTSTIKSNINSFVSAFNSVIAKIDDLTAFDADTLTSQTLFGDTQVLSLKDTLVSELTDNMPGLTGDVKALSQIGISLDTSNQLEVDDTTLSSALSNNLDSVMKLFRATGVATNNSVSYVSSTDKTQASGSAGYAVNITQAAQQATYTGSTSSASGLSETLTFTGGAFGSSGHVVSIAAGSTLADVVAKLNGDSTVSGILGASISNGVLKLTTKQYGSAATFTVSSSQALANSVSGIGSTSQTVSGVDVAGTINGETATGNGQYLTGASGNATTDGLQLRITSAVTGSLGTITVSTGAASLAENISNSATDSIDGSLVVYSKQLGDQSDEITDQITSVKARLAIEEDQLREQFTAMETALTKLDSVSSSLALLGVTTSSSSSSSSSSNSSSSSS